MARLLYALPVTGPTHANPGYILASGCELLALEQEILTAMTEGSAMTVRLAEGLGQGDRCAERRLARLRLFCPSATAS